MGPASVLLLPLLISVTSAGRSRAQSSRPIVVSAGTHALTVPWYTGPLATRLNPAVFVGSESSLRSGDDWRVTFALNLGFFRDHWWMTGVSVEPELGIGRRLPGGLHAGLGLGLGYLHYFWRRQTLELEEGRYIPAPNRGRPSVILPLSITLGYRGDPEHPLSVAPFVSMRWGVQGLFLDEVPAMTHLFLLAGVRIRRDAITTTDGR